MQTVRSVLRALGASTAVLLAAFVPLLAGAPGARAAAAEAQQAQQPLAISITGLSPSTAGPNSTVVVSGTLANHTGSTVDGITVQASTSASWFTFPDQMTEFTDGIATNTSPLALEQAGTQYLVPGSVSNGATVRWTVSFPASVFYSQFGVYPVQVQAAGAGSTATARTLLPYWPGGSAASQIKGLQTAWVWPLIDTPQQGACSNTLRTSSLASSVASGGRLSTLLNAGGSAVGQADQVTWDIDPALLSDVSVMTGAHYTGGNAECTERSSAKPSAAAKQWLAQLQTSTSGQSAFLSPYANVDVAALSHSGLDVNIQSAYQLGETVAGQILPTSFGPKGTGGGDGAVLKAAWPAGGLADAGVLTSLASEGGVNTVVLSNQEVPPAATDDAVAKTVNSVGGTMSLLLANSTITSLLGTAAKAQTPASQFALTQDFLAQTAMIAAELPSTSRSLVIAPPTDWAPSSGVANALLDITHNAPWLHSTALSTLATQAAKLPATTRVQAKQVSGAELSDGYLDQVSGVQAGVSVFKDLLFQPPAREVELLDEAVTTLQSSAWRGNGSAGGFFATSLLSGYLKHAQTKVAMIASKKILLAGQSGQTPVSVHNGLGFAIQVQVMALTPNGSQFRVDTSNGSLTVPANGSGTVKMSVHSSMLGTTTVRLQLATMDGSPLTWTAQPLSVEVTRFGRLLLIIIGGALGILVLTSVYRLRRKRLAGAKRSGTADDTAQGGGAG